MSSYWIEQPHMSHKSFDNETENQASLWAQEREILPHVSVFTFNPRWRSKLRARWKRTLVTIYNFSLPCVTLQTVPRQKGLDLGVHVRRGDVTFHGGHVSSGMWPVGPLCVCALPHVALMCCRTALPFTIYSLPGSKSKRSPRDAMEWWTCRLVMRPC